YPVLLFLQICIIALMAKVCRDMRRHRGVFARPNQRFGKFLLEGGAIYLLMMVLRYAMHMALYPHERWFGGALPIFFHCVLASFVLVWGTFHLRSATRIMKRRSWRSLVFRLVTATGMLMWLSYQLAPAVMAHIYHLRPAEFAVRIERDVPVPVEDGVIL